jgi:adenine-specific DNA methylase
MSVLICRFWATFVEKFIPHMFAMSKRAGNPSEFKLNEMSEHLCKISWWIKFIHCNWPESLIAQNIITANTTYFELKTDVVKLKLIKKGLSLGLNESIALSKYGLFIVSDFDLYHNMNTPKAYDSFLESLKFNKNCPEYIKLRQNRLNLDSQEVFSLGPFRVWDL